ncbi:hypothetical protein QUF75_18510 [Desulfococcaceae bacterium HSG7]|nr:hypothetical protein [Desulfococcaceae bacterium HSG7]
MKKVGRRLSSRLFWVIYLFLLHFTCVSFLDVQVLQAADTATKEYKKEHKVKYKKVKSKQITYSSHKKRIGKHAAPETLGMVRGKNLPPIWPESFINGPNGNFYICDTVNQRIQIYSPEGNFSDQISLPEGSSPNDIVVDDLNNIYVYDGVQKKLYHVDNTKEVVKTINIKKKLWRCRSTMHLVNNNIYITNCDQEDILIGEIVNGHLKSPSGNSKPEKGIHSSSGKRYFVKLYRWKKGVIHIIDESGVVKYIDFPMHGIVSIKFLREDKEENIYIRTERATKEKLLLEVHKFDSDGNYLATALIPENDYMVLSAKLLSISESGDIWQLLPSLESANLNIFKLYE